MIFLMHKAIHILVSQCVGCQNIGIKCSLNLPGLLIFSVWCILEGAINALWNGVRRSHLF
jgi:hypothetical protein